MRWPTHFAHLDVTARRVWRPNSQLTPHVVLDPSQEGLGERVTPTHHTLHTVQKVWSRRGLQWAVVACWGMVIVLVVIVVVVMVVPSSSSAVVVVVVMRLEGR